MYRLDMFSETLAVIYYFELVITVYIACKIGQINIQLNNNVFVYKLVGSKYQYM